MGKYLSILCKSYPKQESEGENALKQLSSLKLGKIYPSPWVKWLEKYILKKYILKDKPCV